MKKIGVTASMTIAMAYTDALRVSSVVWKMMPAIDASEPSLRASRRRMIFSVSITASSITTPRATISPAMIMLFRVAPPSCRASSAASSESGMAMAAMSAVRQL